MQVMIRFAVVVNLLGSGTLLAADDSQPALAVTVRVDAASTKGALRPIWRFFGADEP